MAQLPIISRFDVSDFADQASWISKLFYPLNLLINGVKAALSNGITISQNVLGQVTTISVTGGTNASTAFSYKFSAQGAPIGVSLVNVTASNGTASGIVNATTCQWTYSSGTISINNITGLSANVTYNCTFIVWGG